jgi:hypothetical protein
MHCFEGFLFWWHRPKLEGHVLMASTKKCFSFQDCMHDLLDITREFSLGLLCLTGSEACPRKLNDARFCPVLDSEQKRPEFTEGTFHYLDVRVILHQEGAHEECRSLKKRRATTTSHTTSVRYIRKAWIHVPAESHSKLLFTISGTVAILWCHQKPQPSWTNPKSVNVSEICTPIRASHQYCLNHTTRPMNKNCGTSFLRRY